MRRMSGIGHGSPPPLSLLCLLASALVLCGACASSEPHAPSAGPSPGKAAETSPGYVRDLSPSDFHEYLVGHSDVFVLDVRQPVEWNDDLGHLEGAVQIPLDDLESRLAELPPDHDRPIAIYCRIGVRSAGAARIVARQGYREVVSLLGGLAAYRKAGF